MHFGPAAAVFLFMPFLAIRFVHKSKLDLDSAHDRSIREFVRAVEQKDPYTRNHSERVAEIVIAIHRELGTPERELSDRYLAALLHDVGKIVVSSAVLTKPGKLTPAEYDEVKRHVVVGADAVRKIDLLSHLADEVLLHHERLDGTGYPFGLRGDEIPRNVRILSVADCFEAMTSARVYRSAFTASEAAAELQRVAGTQLDPEPVEALIRVIDSGIAFANPATTKVIAAERLAVGES
jgi:putative nucleotidyltransferase with HDIG domain